MKGKRRNPYSVDETEENQLPIKRRKKARKITGKKSKKGKKRKVGEITQLKKLIVKLIKKFESDLSHPEDFTGFWGEKESPVSVITKLSQILLKLFSIAGPKPSGKSISALIKEEFSEEDFMILSHFAENNKP